MQDKKSVLRSLFLSALVPAVIAAIISPVLGVSVFIATFALAALVGYPLFLLFRRHSFANVWIASAVGLAVGVAVGGYMFWPLKYPDLKTTSWRGSDANRVYTMIEGVPTQIAWNDFYGAAAIFGVLGALSGLVFWLLMRKPANDA
jgi:uncharacterized membrane protein